MNFELRTGLVSVATLLKQGASVEVAKFAISDKSKIAMIRGGGLGVAERLVKDPSAQGAAFRLELDGTVEADVTSFDGLSCRWDPIKAKRGEIMSLLVVALTQMKPEVVYKRVLAKIEAILDENESRPANSEQSSKTINYGSILKEMRMHTIGQPARLKFKRLIAILFEAAALRLSMAGFKTGSFSAEKYIREMGENTDFQKFDDMLRMVRDCSVKQRNAITEMLESERISGEIAYGMHL